ncbi:MAG: right-handed parallel beta-helix repeat-containing protein, partial [Acidimicrobiia bacterium]
CPEGQVVELAVGTYTTSSTITLTKGVVLRGKGSAGAANGGTTIEKTGGGSVLAIGSSQDQACYSGAYGAAYALTADAVKETATVTVGATAGQFAAGDLALLDEADDGDVKEGDCQYFKRMDKRSVSERVEVATVDAGKGTLHLSSPLHWTFRMASPHSAQIAKVMQPITRWAGIEGVSLRGGSNPGYDGQMAGGIDISNAAYCWIKDVQTDDSIGGMHVALTGTFRTVVRDSYFHNSANYGFGADCYGIVLRCGAADNLVENNIARYMNKPILFNVSGGGNVVGYNYADNSWATPAAWQEVNIDTHCAFPHMELMEGNYAPHMGATITHGNAGYLTYFRNYASSQFAAPAVAGSTDKQTGNIAALQFDSGDIDMTVVGNVLGSSSADDLGTAPVSMKYISSGPDAPTVFELGDNANHNGDSQTDVAFTSLHWHANYDPVSPGVVWNPAISVRTLPASLYLSGKPAWWPADEAWPWAGSDLMPRVGTLPAKARSDALGH